MVSSCFKDNIGLRLSVGASVLTALLGSLAFLADAGCAQSEGRLASQVKELTWSYPDGPMGPIEVAVAVPLSASADRPAPVLIALHGQGESRKTPEKGARGWLDDYGMRRALARLAKPPLYREDFGGMVTDDRLSLLNDSLKRRPYRGVIVVCPYLPDRFRKSTLHEDAAAYGDFLVKTLLPRVRKETPASKERAATGIDGVSLGGRAAVVAGLANPNTFGAVGGMQAAFGEEQVPSLVALLKKARKKSPKLSFRLLSSEHDRFLGVTRQFSRALEKAGEPHRTDILKGDHSYEFNRGPGVYEMLLYYDRILRGEDYL